MKKRFIVLVAAAIGFAHQAQAQLNKQRNSFVGVKVGGSAATFIGDEAKNLRFVYGLNAGVFANLALLEPFSLQPEVLFSMKGVKADAGISDATVLLNYIDVPLLLRASTFYGLFGEAGPQAGYLLSAKANAGGEKIDVKAAYRTIDFGYVLGVGYQPPQGGLGAGARYNASFLSALKTPDGGSEAPDLRNSAFQLYLSYTPHPAPRGGKHRKR